MLHNVFHTTLVRYSLFVLKVAVSMNHQPNLHKQSQKVLWKTFGSHSLTWSSLENTGCPMVMESHGIYEDHFPGLETHGK